MHPLASFSEQAEIATTISRYQPVAVVADPDFAADARDALPASVAVLPIPLNDAWLRDTAPTWVYGHAGRGRAAGAAGPPGTAPGRVAVGWTFNGWGGNLEDGACYR